MMAFNGCLPLFSARQFCGSEAGKTRLGGGQGTARLAVLRDERSALPWKSYW